MITIQLNGQPEQVREGATIAQLIEQRGLAPNKVAIELNRRLLRSERYDTLLRSGDEVEIVTFVGGG